MTNYEHIHTVLTTGQAAQLLNINITTIQRWCDCGNIKSYRIGPRGERVLRREDISNILAQNNSPQL